MQKIYVVTLYNKDDLDGFYQDMESNGFQLSLKRPLSRNTHYWMTADQAEQLKQDSRVWDVQLLPEEMGMTIDRYVVNNTPYTVSGNFWKEGSISSTYRQWGHLHCAGTPSQRRKGVFGDGATGLVSDTVEVFGDGSHVDVVICDDPVSYDCAEWEDSGGTNRFVQYQWFNELNQYVSSIDDDGQTLPTGSITYYTNSSNPEYHGVHVTGTVAGKYYGWAKNANIYGLQVLGTMPSGQSLPALLIFDYLRAFHRHKAINPTTGKRNPTITNHSWGYGYNLSGSFPSGFAIENITQIFYEGTVYNSSNPGPSGWTMGGIEADFGIGAFKTRIPADYTALNADVADAVEDGVVIVGAAGNDNFHMVENTHPSWNNTVTISGAGTYYFNRGSAPVNASGVVRVGALNDAPDFRRSTYTNYGPAITVFAPGDDILSSFNSDGILDGKYGGSNYYYPIQGTSMASPQVCGIAACLASGRSRFTNEDLKGFIQKLGYQNDMSFDVTSGNFADNTCQKDSPNLYMTISNPRETTGYISTQKGERKSFGVAFPRTSVYHQNS